jgi:hypothetical protein
MQWCSQRKRVYGGNTILAKKKTLHSQINIYRQTWDFGKEGKWSFAWTPGTLENVLKSNVRKAKRGKKWDDLETRWREWRECSRPEYKFFDRQTSTAEAKDLLKKNTWGHHLMLMAVWAHFWGSSEESLMFKAMMRMRVKETELRIKTKHT